MQEEYRPVVGFEGLYEISNFGNIRRCTRKVRYRVHRTTGTSIQHATFQQMQKRPYTNLAGYTGTFLIKNGKSYWKNISMLVAQAFLPNPEHKRCVCNLDGNRQNNRLENLAWSKSSKETKQLQDTYSHRTDAPESL